MTTTAAEPTTNRPAHGKPFVVGEIVEWTNHSGKARAAEDPGFADGARLLVVDKVGVNYYLRALHPESKADNIPHKDGFVNWTSRGGDLRQPVPTEDDTVVSVGDGPEHIRVVDPKVYTGEPLLTVTPRPWATGMRLVARIDRAGGVDVARGDVLTVRADNGSRLSVYNLDQSDYGNVGDVENDVIPEADMLAGNDKDPLRVTYEARSALIVPVDQFPRGKRFIVMKDAFVLENNRARYFDESRRPQLAAGGVVTVNRVINSGVNRGHVEVEYKAGGYTGNVWWTCLQPEPEGVKPEPPKGDANDPEYLRAMLAWQKYEFDLLNWELNKEAVARQWCGEYESVQKRLNEQTTEFRLADRKELAQNRMRPLPPNANFVLDTAVLPEWADQPKKFKVKRKQIATVYVQREVVVSEEEVEVSAYDATEANTVARVSGERFGKRDADALIPEGWTYYNRTETTTPSVEVIA